MPRPAHDGSATCGWVTPDADLPAVFSAAVLCHFPLNVEEAWTVVGYRRDLVGSSSLILQPIESAVLRPGELVLTATSIPVRAQLFVILPFGIWVEAGDSHPADIDWVAEIRQDVNRWLTLNRRLRIIKGCEEALGRLQSDPDASDVFTDIRSRCLKISLQPPPLDLSESLEVWLRDMADTIGGSRDEVLAAVLASLRADGQIVYSEGDQAFRDSMDAIRQATQRLATLMETDTRQKKPAALVELRGAVEVLAEKLNIHKHVTRRMLGTHTKLKKNQEGAVITREREVVRRIDIEAIRKIGKGKHNESGDHLCHQADDRKSAVLAENPGG